MKYSEYRDLTPINNVKDGDEYLNALDWALKIQKLKILHFLVRMEQVKVVLLKHI